MRRGDRETRLRKKREREVFKERRERNCKEKERVRKRGKWGKEDRG